MRGERQPDTVYSARNIKKNLEAGNRRIQVWVSPAASAAIDAIQRLQECSQAAAVDTALRWYADNGPQHRE